MLDMRMAGEADLADHAHAFRLGINAGEMDTLAGLIHFDAIEAFIEIEMPPGPAEFAVGREPEPDLFLLPDDFLDLAIFHRLQCVGGQLTLGVFGARILQRGRTQQAADMVGAERAAWSARSLPPHLVRQFDDHAQLGPLLVLRQNVAFFGRGKAALR